MGIAQVPYGILVIDFNGEMKTVFVGFEPKVWKQMKKDLKKFYVEEFLPRIIHDSTFFHKPIFDGCDCD